MDIKANTPKDESRNINPQKINNTAKDKTITQLVLEGFLVRGEQGMNTYDAFYLFNVTCLHTYVSNFQKKHNLSFTKTPEIHTRINGEKRRHVNYSLFTPSQVVAAKVLLSYFDEKRGASA
jgi:hypothetical protein